MIVKNLANKLTLEYGGSQFGKRSLHRMMQFATTFPYIKIVTPLVTQLSWSHFLQVIVERAKMRIAQSKMENGMPMYNDNTNVEPDNADN